MRRGMHWLSWERLSIHKNYGGMGFKDLTSFNVSMLGKRGWKFHTDTSSLISHLFKERYFSNCDYLSSRIGHNPRYVRRCIFRVKIVVN